MQAPLTSAQRTWRHFTAIPLLVASVAFLVALSWRVIGDIHGPAAVPFNVVLIVTWIMFITDYTVQLVLSESRWLWFRTHLADLAITIMPVLRLVRLLRVFTELPGVRHTRAGLRRNRLAIYGIGSVVILVYIAALRVLDVERNAPGATITNFGDAIWWACTTATTTGYGDYTPITPRGRVIGVCVMFGGLVLVGILTATLSSWVVERSQSQAESPADAPAPPADRGDGGEGEGGGGGEANADGEADAASPDAS